MSYIFDEDMSIKDNKLITELLFQCYIRKSSLK